ncbi:hypothetical protein ACP4OV_001444 [Aristida adscensionis]
MELPATSPINAVADGSLLHIGSDLTRRCRPLRPHRPSPVHGAHCRPQPAAHRRLSPCLQLRRKEEGCRWMAARYLLGLGSEQWSGQPGEEEQVHRETEGEEAGRELGEQTEASTLEPHEIEYGVQEIIEERSSRRRRKRLMGADAQLSWTPGHTCQIAMVKIIDASSIPRC